MTKKKLSTKIESRKKQTKNKPKRAIKNLKTRKDLPYIDPLTFGMAVEVLRARDGITQTDFAKKMQVSKQYLCDVEKGRRFVSPLQAARFAKVFGHSRDVLVKLSIQDTIRAAGLKVKVTVEA